ncbi:hypothetical protein PybrP1_003982 [[Pythium] brassicae (nom. inval.)]|nr:hypothetical protein PybrP1_003982 [[Pythium] brassicae (nom. inval.)]
MADAVERVTVTISTTDDATDECASSQTRSASPEPSRSALTATLGIASSAANLVLYPYVTAGKAAYQATSLVVHAPLALSRHVTHSLLGGAQPNEANSCRQEATAACDLFGERASTDVTVRDCESEAQEQQQAMTLFGEQQLSTVIVGATSGPETGPNGSEEAPGAVESASRGGVVSQLLFLPVRLVSTGVSTAAALPGSLLSYSGRKLSGAVTTSQALATTAIVVSSGAVARTSLHVAQGLTYSALSTASFTATTLSGAVGTSVRTVGYAIPASLSNAVWQGVGATGSASVSVVSYAIAVPAYRMLAALVPDVTQHISERDCVETTREAVQLLVKVLGPQNAYYLLKFVYETVNSDEAYDMFLLCHDIMRESLDGRNYRRAGASLGDATGVSTLAPVVAEIYNMLPSAGEMFDAFAFVADVSGELLDSLVAPSPSSTVSFEKSSARFEYVEEDGESTASTSDEESAREDENGAESSSHSTISNDVFFEQQLDSDNDSDSDEQRGVEGVEERVVQADIVDGFRSRALPLEEQTAVDMGVAFLAQVCDSDEAASLFDAFGDFLDVLVN